MNIPHIIKAFLLNLNPITAASEAIISRAIIIITILYYFTFYIYFNISVLYHMKNKNLIISL